MADSSAIDDTAAEARDLLLGDMVNHVLDDINGNIYANVTGFQQAFFDQTGAGGDADAALKLAQDHLGKRPNELWKDKDAPFIKRAFVDDLRDRLGGLEGSSSMRYVGRDDPRIESLEFQGKPDFVLVPKQSSLNQKLIWYDALVLGSIREATSSGYQQAFLQLCGQAQSVFQHQPTRRFLHAFSIYGFTLELMVFDRAGVIASEPLDLRTHFLELLKTLYQYTIMPGVQLGASSFIHREGEEQKVQLQTNDRQKTQDFLVDDEPLAWPDKLLTKPGAWCLQARSKGSDTPDVVVKFIWESDADRHEIGILSKATERGVWGVPQVLGYQELASTRDLRDRVKLGARRQILPQSVQRPSLGEEMIAGMDRRSSEQAADYFDVTKSCLESSTVPVELSTGNDKMVPQHAPEDFTLSCIATAPHGRALASFKTISEALYALRDAVKAHRSLYNQGRYLHCDISRNNIIIPDFVPTSDAPRGILIDFDECVELDATIAPTKDEPGAPTAVEIRGTRAFIAIGLMRGSPHTYRHDLESFLYVLIYLAIARHAHDPPMTSRLNAWQTLDPWPDLAAKKLGMIGDEKAWHVLMEEFTPSFEPYVWLAGKLRALLFRTEEGGVFLGTEDGDEAREKLYDAVIDAFQRAINQAEAA
ncbi:Tyrosine-protein kinase, active site protein [Sarocladium implicatum]|nr:Tyrosine-protein kinase, active site protein [Sarocladium implicatum]